MKKILLLSVVVTQLFACSAEVGTDKWCGNLDAKAKGDWTMNEANDYAKHCIFKG